jgi:predicted nucleotidyltransferase
MNTSARDELLTRIITALSADRRVAAVWLAGSFGRDEQDAWSDLDLHVAVFDEDLAAFWADRHVLFERVGRPVLIQPEIPSNAPAGGHFQLVIFDGPLEVDWNVGPFSLARRAPAHVLLMGGEGVPLAVAPSLSDAERRDIARERVIFLWAMAPIAVKYIARGHTSRALGIVGLVREAFMAVWRLVYTGHGSVNSLNQPLEPELARILPRFESQIDPAECLAVLLALCAATQQLHPRLAALGVEVPEEMPAQLARLVAQLPDSARGREYNRRPRTS